jgi:hypothetical protein
MKDKSARDRLKSRSAGLWPACRKGKLNGAGETPALRFLVLSVVLFLLTAIPANALEYLFSVPMVNLDSYVQRDGSVILKYEIQFRNATGAHPIDIVDIGMPTANYRISDMTADLDGEPCKTIKPSQYVSPGVEVHLGRKTIPAEGEGTLHFETRIPDLVFSDTTRKDYASFQITPTWFGNQYVEGSTSTNLTLRIHLPEGVNPDEVLYQNIPFTGKDVEEGSVVVSWDNNYRFTSEYRVGVSFPRRVMSRMVEINTWYLIKKWVEQNIIFFLAADCILFFFLLIFAFRRLTGGTGSCLMVPLLGLGLAAYFTTLVTVSSHALLWLGLITCVVLVEWARRHKKMKYLPALVSVEGGGIKRGLTAPEAAVLLELPPNKVVTMILFGLMKKGLIRQVCKDPVGFKLGAELPADVVLNGYEKEMLEALKKRETSSADKEARLKDMDLTDSLKNAARSVAAKMQGFNVEETQEYYKYIIARAWKEAQAIGEVPDWQQKMDQKVDWLILDNNFDDRFRPYATRYSPTWYRGPISTSGSAGGISAPSTSGGGPRISDIAGSVTGWMENTAGAVVTHLEGSKPGLLNLSGLDKAMASSGGAGGSHSGGGGGCACACAGCACACACAGGGR